MNIIQSAAPMPPSNEFHMDIIQSAGPMSPSNDFHTTKEGYKMKVVDLAKGQKRQPISSRDIKVCKCYLQMKRAAAFFAEQFSEYILVDKTNPMSLFLNVSNPSGGQGCNVNIHWNQLNEYVECGKMDTQLFAPFEDFLELFVHEFTHGYLQYKKKLSFISGQTGPLSTQTAALNESIADIIGIMAKQKVLSQNDWLFANGFVLCDKDKMALRSFEDPGKAHAKHAFLGEDLQAKDMKFFRDVVGCHHDNSGIPSHAFYLAVKKVDNGLAYGKVAQVWFEAVQRSKEYALFIEFAKSTLEAAKIIFKNEPEVEKSIHEAWSLVGIDPQGKIIKTETDMYLMSLWAMHKSENIKIEPPEKNPRSLSRMLNLSFLAIEQNESKEAL